MRVIKVCQTLLSGNEAPVCIYRQQHRDGHYVWLEASYRLIRDPAGEPCGFLASVRDVSQRHYVESAAAEALARLEEGDRLFRMATALANIGHWRLDVIRSEVRWSDEVYRIFGVGREHQPTLENAIDTHHPDDRERVRHIIATAVESGEPYEYTATLLMPDATAKTITVRGHTERAPDGQVIGIIGVIQDISAQISAQEALRRSEQGYRLLAENATDVVLRTSDDGSVVYISPSCIELSGFRPRDLVGRPASDFIHPSDYGVVHAAHIAIITRAQNAVTVEYRLRHKDGGWRWLESHMKPWRGPEGDSGGVISSIRDIARRKALETELVDARDAAEAAARTKSAFLANMSHEIRTPMNGVLGFTELVLSGQLDPKQRQHVELIAESGRSMMRLLNDILDMSQIEAGMMRLTAEAVDLRHTIKRCVELMSPVAQAKGVDISAAVEPAVPVKIAGDPLRLRQILLNLIGNAAKFTAVGSVDVHARVVGSALAIDVVDTGIGIAASRLGSIFEQFTQADDTTTKAFGGSGLGLTISAQLARLMGGSIAVRSAVGVGTTFTLTLPLVTWAEATDPTGGLDVAEPIAPDVVRKPRVLIAEDHDINQALILAMAHRAGMDPAIAADGAEAVTMVQEAAAAHRPFELVLMDMQMPIVDGLEASRRIRAAGFSPDLLPIVALTANAYVDDIQACFAAGMQAHLAKPVRVRDLTDILARFVAAHDQPSPPCLNVAPEATDPLLARYDARKRDLLVVMAAIVAEGQCSEDEARMVIDLLHKLAGVAGFFGEEPVGQLAAALERRLESTTGEMRMAALRAGRKELRNFSTCASHVNVETRLNGRS